MTAPPTETTRFGVPYKLFRGYKIPRGGNETNFHQATSYTPCDNDFFVVSYPKCGTTWTQHVVYLLHNKGVPSKDASDVISSIPFVEQDGFPDHASRLVAMKYHLPFRMMPFSERAKYIYVARNPKDTCVSYYKFLQSLPGYEIDSFDDFFEAFVAGELPYGDHLDHVTEWHDRRHLPNVLFFTYEDMKRHHRDTVLMIARFLEIKDVDERVLEGVVEHSSFDFMKRHVNRDDFMINYLRQSAQSGNDVTTKLHSELPIMLRKGIVGDWRNYFSPEQSAKMDARISLEPSLVPLWSDVMAY